MPKLKFYMEWFNAWVGFYADVEKYRIYFQPIPCFGDKATGARINFMAGKNNWILLSCDSVWTQTEKPRLWKFVKTWLTPAGNFVEVEIEEPEESPMTEQMVRKWGQLISLERYGG